MMFWDDTPSEEVESGDIIDLTFRVDCRCLPLDHAHALSQALLAALPWLGQERLAGMQTIRGAESGNGWIRPQDPERDLLQLSRRTRLRLRLPVERADEARELEGRTLDIAGFSLRVGEPSVQPLQALPTLLAHHVVADENETETAFLERMAQDLRALGIPVSKMLCGLNYPIRLPQVTVHTRSLMVAELEPHESITLLREGLGPGRMMGCGLFIGHKDIAPVKKAVDA